MMMGLVAVILARIVGLKVAMGVVLAVGYSCVHFN